MEEFEKHLFSAVIMANKNNDDKIEVWGDGMQTRTFLYIDD